MKSFIVVMLMVLSVSAQSWRRNDLRIDSSENIHCFVTSPASNAAEAIYMGTDSGVLVSHGGIGYDLGVSPASRFADTLSTVWSICETRDSFIVAVDTEVKKSHFIGTRSRVLLDSVSRAVAYAEFDNHVYTVVCGIRYMMLKIDSADWYRTRVFPGDTIKRMTLWNTTAYVSDGVNWYRNGVYPSYGMNWVADTTITMFAGSRFIPGAMGIAAKVTKANRLMLCKNGVTWIDITGDIGDVDSIAFMDFGSDNRVIYVMKKDYSVYTLNVEDVTSVSMIPVTTSRHVAPVGSRQFDIAGRVIMTGMRRGVSRVIIGRNRE